MQPTKASREPSIGLQGRRARLVIRHARVVFDPPPAGVATRVQGATLVAPLGRCAGAGVASVLAAETVEVRGTQKSHACYVLLKSC